MTNSLDRVGEWMRMMAPKTYGPRDLREAYRMPREDAVWIMEHCADKWEAERKAIIRLVTGEDEEGDWERVQAMLEEEAK